MEKNHAYGPNVHILDNIFAESLLAELSSPETIQPKINQLIKELYFVLLSQFINKELLKENFQCGTRMTSHHPDQLLSGQRIVKDQSVVCVDLARAGILPTQTAFDFLHLVLNPTGLRQDHIFASRQTDENHQVIGTYFGDSKIGGPIKDAIVLIADPMGATGNTINSTISHYKSKIAGPARKYIALHLIVTPEYLKKVTALHPDAIVYALRVDRGLSSKKVLDSKLGEYWDEEVGLNKFDYIVPGAGGLGEIMNNSFV